MSNPEPAPVLAAVGQAVRTAGKETGHVPESDLDAIKLMYLELNEFDREFVVTDLRNRRRAALINLEQANAQAYFDIIQVLIV